MPTSHLEFLVEERSMEDFLKACLPRILPTGCTFGIHPYRGKQALLDRLEGRLKGYRQMQTANRIVVVVDRDTDDCQELKSGMEKICSNAGLRSRQVAAGCSDWQVVTRIVVEELEAWYFGDWPAVRRAYPRVPENIPSRTPYRDPDAIKGGTWEAFERILQRCGYYKQGLDKPEAARKIGKYLHPKNNRSHSFQVFHSAIIEAVTLLT